MCTVNIKLHLHSFQRETCPWKSSLSKTKTVFPEKNWMLKKITQQIQESWSIIWNILFTEEMHLSKTHHVLLHTATSFMKNNIQSNLVVCVIWQPRTHLLLKWTARLVRNLSYASRIIFLGEKCKSSEMDVTVLEKHR